MTLTDDDFDAVRSYLLATAGLVFDQSRRAGLSSVVADRLRVSGAPDVTSYLGSLTGPQGEAERQRLLDGVTVQETHFFRNAPQIEALRRRVLPELLGHYREFWAPHTVTDPQVRPLWEWLAGQGISVGVLSNTIWPREWHEEFFDRDGVLDLIDGAVYRLKVSGRTEAARRALCLSNASTMSTDLLRSCGMIARSPTRLKPRNFRGNTKYSRSSSEPRNTRLSRGNRASSSSKPICRTQSSGARVTTGSPKSSRWRKYTPTRFDMICS